jgi:hypothetical protein
MRAIMGKVDEFEKICDINKNIYNISILSKISGSGFRVGAGCYDYH